MRALMPSPLKKLVLLILVATLCGCSPVREKFIKLMLEPSPPTAPDDVEVVSDIHGWGGDFYTDKPIDAARAFFDRHLQPEHVAIRH